MGLVMLDYLIATCLLLLIVAQAYIAKGCFSLNEKLCILPEQAEKFGEKFGLISELLEEVAEAIYDLGGGTPQSSSNAPAGNPLEAILGSLISNTMNPTADSNAEKEQSWTVYETAEQTQKSEEDN